MCARSAQRLPLLQYQTKPGYHLVLKEWQELHAKIQSKSAGESSIVCLPANSSRLAQTYVSTSINSKYGCFLWGRYGCHVPRERANRLRGGDRVSMCLTQRGCCNLLALRCHVMTEGARHELLANCGRASSKRENVHGNYFRQRDNAAPSKASLCECNLQLPQWILVTGSLGLGLKPLRP